MDKPFYSLLMNSPSNKVFGSVRNDGIVLYRIIVWMTDWNAFVLHVEDYKKQPGNTIYRLYDCRNGFEALERLLDYFGLPVSSDAWTILRS